ncbi:MAG: hypothetical protein ACE5K7_06260 [Phycisphaerae bacterium]
MPQREDWLREDEYPDQQDVADDEDSAVVACPTCGRMIAEDSPRCPYCQTWVVQESQAAERSRGWFWPALVGALIVGMLLLWGGLGR